MLNLTDSSRGKVVHNRVLIDKKYKWVSLKKSGYLCFFRGWFKYKSKNFQGKEASEKIFSLFADNKIGIDEISNIIKRLSGNFSFILEAHTRILAVVDKICSFPVFYTMGNCPFMISNSARALKIENNLFDIDKLSLLEFRMAGYVTGRETLFKGLHQLQPGEFLVWDNDINKLKRKRYYIFFNKNVRSEKEDDLIEELDEITNQVIYSVIEMADGAPIWVPLSGGLDSRLILCKLKQLKYDNLTAFSYGPSGNHEAKTAQHVAQKIKVKWHLVPYVRKEVKKYFWSEERRRYWEFSDGLFIAPNIHWIDSINYFLKNKTIPENTIIVNGQSGDFIAGNHIPKVDKDNFSQKLLCQEIIKKHYSLLADHLNRGDYIELINKKILETITQSLKIDINNYQTFAKFYEFWGWQERQCKRVINGQRHYDYYGFMWRLPLWDDAYLNYWDSIPLEFKMQRYLFRKYLENKDFYKLFKNYKPVTTHWPDKLTILEYLVGMANRVFGNIVAKKLTNYFEYFGNYSTLYAPFSYFDYMKVCHNYKGPLPFFTRTWEKEYLEHV